MTTLALSKSECNSLRNSWADAIACCNFNEQDFVKLLFSNLIASERRMNSLFKNSADLREQEHLFKEMVSFVMIYMEKATVLEECMVSFVQENPSLIKFGLSYLEPLGSQLIKTLRQVLGAVAFNENLGSLWIKFYVYLANSILQSETSDDEPVISKKSESHGLLDKEVEPLNLKPFSPPKTYNRNTSGSRIIDLQANERYKGFRRSANGPSRSTVRIEVPVTESYSRNTSLEFAENFYQLSDPCLTPRSHFRNSAQQLKDLGINCATLSESCKPPSSPKSSSFDPRRKTCHSRSSSEVNLDLEHQRKESFSSARESPKRDFKKNQVDFSGDEINFDSPFEMRPTVFDHNSFGIVGLDPIAESDDDEKSNYSDGNTSSSCDATNEGTSESSYSRTSSLSLHNSDYKSSISSGSGHSRFMEKRHTQTRSSGNSGSLQEFSSPYTHTRCSSSVPSLISKSSGQRASMGFMKSSYVFKKEVDSSRESYLDNTSLPAFSQPFVSRSVCSLPLRERSTEAQSNRMGSIGEIPRNGSQTIPRLEKETLSIKSSKPEKSSFRKLLRGIFGSSTSSPSMKDATISQPIARTIPSERNTKMNKKYYPSGVASTAPSMYSCKRVSAIDVRGPSVPAGYAASVFSKPSVISENGSVWSTNSGKKPFSLFRSESKHDTKTKNKYFVEKVAHKTIYLKDIVS